ncbi:hypothetical protein SEA_LILYPAD_73 [Gordonia phage LilyPad]|nr:hypothetical protein SEA_LILYPAD_73 [Gordonia phage LilyPad]
MNDKIKAMYYTEFKNPEAGL